jgi:hypothetical protein
VKDGLIVAAFRHYESRAAESKPLLDDHAVVSIRAQRPDGSGAWGNVTADSLLATGEATPNWRAIRPGTKQKSTGHPGSERFQRCLSRVRTEAAMTLMRLGLQRARRKMRQDFSLATLRSTGARAAGRARLIVC